VEQLVEVVVLPLMLVLQILSLVLIATHMEQEYNIVTQLMMGQPGQRLDQKLLCHVQVFLLRLEHAQFLVLKQQQ
jgi:hypothetical protein